MEDKIIVLGVGKSYNFKTEEGNVISGCKMHYIPAGKFAPAGLNEDETMGYIPLVETMPESFYSRVKDVKFPCVAKVNYVMRNKGGKRVAVIDGLDFINDKLS